MIIKQVKKNQAGFVTCCTMNELDGEKSNVGVDNMGPKLRDELVLYLVCYD